MFNWRGVQSVISSSTPAKATQSYTHSPGTGGCSGLVVVETRNARLHIELACRCGYTQSWSVALGPNELVELDGSAVQLERFSHRPLKSPGGEMSGESHG